MADTGVLLIKSLDKGFVIHGDTIKILQNRFAMMYLRRNLHHSVSGADIVIEDVTDINTIMSHVFERTILLFLNLKTSKNR